MDIIYFTFPGNEELGQRLAQHEQATIGRYEMRKFPDGETYVRIFSLIRNKRIKLICSMNHPDEKILPLYLFCQAARAQGATSITLIAPYLCYLRQDKIFLPGESLTSKHFAAFLSTF